MSPKNRNFMICAILVISLCLSGCLYPRGISITDINTSDKIFISVDSFYFNILFTDDQTRQFVFLDISPDKFILKTMSYEGYMINQKKIDAFNKVFYLDNICSLSPNGRYLAHLGIDKCLYIQDLETGEKTKLIDGQLVSDEMFMRGIKWLSDSEFIIIKKKSSGALSSPMDDNSLTIVNVKTKSVIKKIELLKPEKYKISSLKNYLLLLDGDMVYPDFKLFDLKTLELLQFKKNSGFEYIDDICWSPSEKYIGYIKSKDIIVKSLDTGHERVVKTLPQNAICYHLEFLEDNTLIYNYELKSKTDEKYILWALDLNTGKERILMNDKFNGSIYVVDNGKRIIAEVGYY